MVCNQHHDVSHLSAMQLVGIEPIVTRIPGIDKDNSVVHHMNLYLCTSEEAVNSKIGRCQDGAKVMPSDMERLPTSANNAAILIHMHAGLATEWSMLMTEIHVHSISRRTSAFG